MNAPNVEAARLNAANRGTEPWREWGPYLAERQWGTVREDYSPHGTAWEHFPHDHARSRAHRWGEDGIAGWSDSHSRLCFALAFWNGQDPILKERLFGLTNAEGNHGEDVKELYYYTDGTPTHSWMRMVYKYPQRAFPYTQLVQENARRRQDPSQPEFELLDTGLFDEDRYFDIDIAFAKACADDTLIRVVVHNRGPEPADLHILPHVWFRNTWSWKPSQTRPQLQHSSTQPNRIDLQHPTLGDFVFETEGTHPFWFTENETNTRRLYGQDSPAGHFKDAFHERLIHGRSDATNPAGLGTKACAHIALSIPARGSMTLRFRLARKSLPTLVAGFTRFDALMREREQEADTFYAALQQGIADADQRRVYRQALAGMLWSKQFFRYNVRDWLSGDPLQIAPPPERQAGRNADWDHLNAADILSMPDKWEYPWFAAWDLAFHAIPLAMVDPEFAKGQLVLLTREWYMHANGQVPAYEWAFDDVNPPVHAWATWRVFQMDRKRRRSTHSEDPGDLHFLERVFHKLLLNFTWWVNRKDSEGHNIFQGGFLGLDNIGCFDRSKPLPTGGQINQADGTSWMAMYSLNLLRIALELARHNRAYEDIASKFFEHFLHIAAAINGVGRGALGLWDPQDEFYYDQLQLPGGHRIPMRIRSMVGLIPLFAVETLDVEMLHALPEFRERMDWFLKNRPDLAGLVSRWQERKSGERHLLSLLRGHRMKCLLRRALDESEFLSPYGVRALSKHHERHPYRFETGDSAHEVPYWPAESLNGLFGGNSNWRGPIWMPMNYLLIESLQKFHHYYGDDFKVECPTGSGRYLTLNDIAEELSQRLTRLFTSGSNGVRPIHQAHPKQAGDPHFRDLVLFYEYFHGDSGRGVGASHQTGWTGLVAKLIQPRTPSHAGHHPQRSSASRALD